MIQTRSIEQQNYNTIHTRRHNMPNAENRMSEVCRVEWSIMQFIENQSNKS